MIREYCPEYECDEIGSEDEEMSYYELIDYLDVEECNLEDNVFGL